MHDKLRRTTWFLVCVGQFPAVSLKLRPPSVLPIPWSMFPIRYHSSIWLSSIVLNGTWRTYNRRRDFGTNPCCYIECTARLPLPLFPHLTSWYPTVFMTYSFGRLPADCKMVTVRDGGWRPKKHLSKVVFSTAVRFIDGWTTDSAIWIDHKYV
jgi:hypothetical protein